MKRLGKEFLAGSVFSPDHDRNRTFRRFLRVGNGTAQYSILPDYARKIITQLFPCERLAATGSPARCGVCPCAGQKSAVHPDGESQDAVPDPVFKKGNKI